jgi:hypothetical protein
MRFTATLSYKYTSDEASQDNCEGYLSFCVSTDTLPRAPFTVYSKRSASPPKSEPSHNEAPALNLMTTFIERIFVKSKQTVNKC